MVDLKSLSEFSRGIRRQLDGTVFKSVEVSYPPTGTINIETTNRCTLDCEACPRYQMSRPVGTMSKPTFGEIVDQVSDFTDVDFLWLHHFGDPLLHPSLEELSDYARRRGFKTGINTKGHLLTEERIESLAGSGLDWVRFSFGGIGRRYEELQRGARFESTMEKIESFISRSDGRSRTTVQLLTARGTPRREILRFKERFGGNPGCEIDIRPCHDWIGDSERVNRAVGDGARPEVDYPCANPWTSVSFLWNGDVVPCCADYDGKYVLGNIEDQTLEEIWNNGKMRRLRKAHIDGERGRIELCRSCRNSWKSFIKRFLNAVEGVRSNV